MALIFWILEIISLAVVRWANSSFHSPDYFYPFSLELLCRVYQLHLLSPLGRQWMRQFFRGICSLNLWSICLNCRGSCQLGAFPLCALGMLTGEVLTPLRLLNAVIDFTPVAHPFATGCTYCSLKAPIFIRKDCRLDKDVNGHLTHKLCNFRGTEIQASRGQMAHPGYCSVCGF